VPGAEVDRLFAEARALAERTCDLRSLALLMNIYSNIKLNRGDVPDMVADGLEGVCVAKQTGDPVLIRAVHDLVIRKHAVLGGLAAAQEG
jgi:hypothetical protein